MFPFLRDYGQVVVAPFGVLLPVGFLCSQFEKMTCAIGDDVSAADKKPSLRSFASRTVDMLRATDGFSANINFYNVRSSFVFSCVTGKNMVYSALGQMMDLGFRGLDASRQRLRYARRP